MERPNGEVRQVISAEGKRPIVVIPEGHRPEYIAKMAVHDQKIREKEAEEKLLSELALKQNSRLSRFTGLFKVIPGIGSQGTTQPQE